MESRLMLLCTKRRAVGPGWTERRGPPPRRRRLQPCRVDAVRKGCSVDSCTIWAPGHLIAVFFLYKGVSLFVEEALPGCISGFSEISIISSSSPPSVFISSSVPLTYPPRSRSAPHPLRCHIL